MSHFTHPHLLRPSEIKEDDKIKCSGCEDEVSGSAYICTKPNCKFNLHKICFESPQEILHNSHTHFLTLLPKNHHKNSSCSACGEKAKAFTYHCRLCNFFLHNCCAALPETLKSKDHKHQLSLLNISPYEMGDGDEAVICGVCKKDIERNCWVYFCPNGKCDFGCHVKCAIEKICPEGEEGKDDGGEESSGVSVQVALHNETIKAMDEMARLQLQMDMHYMTAKTTANLFRTRTPY